jgi:hypothetical protein
MNILFGVLIIILSFLIRSWYGLKKGHHNPIFWKPIHSNMLVNFIVIVGSFGLMIVGIAMLFF